MEAVNQCNGGVLPTQRASLDSFKAAAGTREGAEDHLLPHFATVGSQKKVKLRGRRKKEKQISRLPRSCEQR
ncbi:hypothetical protein SAY87_022076 [Trapa incisa]|uniref:Uncharacterized protein n=1 Tax=Trapa incisa TaxID=236973 RepID=A0AAN7JY11_9MYRT|nr:hypothetical protein SAY87_022076 [Trapa incisa]